MRIFIPDISEMSTAFEPSPTFGKGRRCEQCGAKLSEYNPNPVCFCHQLLDPPGAMERVSRMLARDRIKARSHN